MNIVNMFLVIGICSSFAILYFAIVEHAFNGGDEISSILSMSKILKASVILIVLIGTYFYLF